MASFVLTALAAGAAVTALWALGYARRALRRAGAAEARERRLQALAATTNDVLVVTTADHRVEFVGESVAHVLGYNAADYLGRTVTETVHPDDLAAYREFSAAVHDQPGIRTGDFRLRHADGRWRWIAVRASNQLADPGVAGVLTTFRDVTDERDLLEALRAGEALFRSIADSSPLGIFRADGHGDNIYVNERWTQITGIAAEDARGQGWRRMIHPDDRHRTDAQAAAARADAGPWEGRFRITRPDGGARWVDVRTAPVTTPGPGGGTVGTLEDVTAQVATEESAQRLAAVLSTTSDLVGITDTHGRFAYLNDAGRRFAGVAPDDDLSGVDVRTMYPPATIERIEREAMPLLATGEVWSGETPLRRHDGAEVPVSLVMVAQRDGDGNVVTVAAIARDLSDRAKLERQLHHQAMHDPLTGLPNRVLLLDRLAMAMARAERFPEGRVALLFCDLDNFKFVNDSLGHDVGDRLLVAVAAKVRAVVRPADTVARFGGDEFVVLCADLGSERDALVIAERVADAVGGSFEVEGHEVFPSVSVGIAFQRRSHTRPDDLLRDADAAMYRAKERGRARVEVFDDEMRARATLRLETERALRRALDRRELRVLYQPVHHVDDGRLAGFEALLRWDHTERGMLTPADFIGVAEETGLIVPMGMWVLQQACRQHQRWRAARPDLGPLTIAVNLSARQLGHPGLVEDVGRVLDETGIDPASVELEVTESVLMDDAAASVALLDRLKGLGVKLGIDDFGTGYSSLAYLRRFPVDVLKIDKEFVDGLGRDHEDSEIVRLVVTLAHSIGLSAVAEGVENGAQLEALRALGCDRLQGWLTGRPMTAADADDLLARLPRPARTVAPRHDHQVVPAGTSGASAAG